MIEVAAVLGGCALVCAYAAVRLARDAYVEHRRDCTPTKCTHGKFY